VKHALESFVVLNAKKNDTFGINALEKENYKLRFDPVYQVERLRGI